MSAQSINAGSVLADRIVAEPARPAGSPSAERSLRAPAVRALYALGAAALAAEGAVHVQQIVVILHSVPWIGPLFALNAAGSAMAAVGLIFRRTRPLAALAGVAISASALGGLALSYTHGIFGWKESGMRPPIEIAILAETIAVFALATALALSRAFRLLVSSLRSWVQPRS